MVRPAFRLLRWRELVRQIHGMHGKRRVELVNRFFNRIPIRTDLAHRGRDDYWATPMEMLLAYGGDCEDFALAKYFTLRAAGVPNDRLRVTMCGPESRAKTGWNYTWCRTIDPEKLFGHRVVSPPHARVASHGTGLSP